HQPAGSDPETGGPGGYSGRRRRWLYGTRSRWAEPLELGTVGRMESSPSEAGGRSALRSLHFGTIPAWNQIPSLASGQGSSAMPPGSSGSRDQVAADAATQVRVSRLRFPRVFLLSPARIGGPRSVMLMREQAEFDLA